MYIIPGVPPAAGSDTASTTTTTTSSAPTKHAQTPKYTLIIYGATSFTGRIIVEYLLAHAQLNPTAVDPPAGRFNFALAGRSEGKLRRMRAETGLEDTDLLVCALERQDEVDEMVRLGGVVMNLAGPYSTQNAELLIRACAHAGRHYVDLTGETPWFAAMIRKYDYLASKTGACIVPSVGFDSIPSDLGVYLAAKHLAAQQGGTDARIARVQTWVRAKGGVSGGTVGSAYALAEMDPVMRKMGAGEFALCTKPDSAVRSPRFKLHYANALLGAQGCFFVMAPHNSAVVRRSWALFQSPPVDAPGARAEATRPAAYGRGFTYEEIMIAPAERGSMGGWLASWITGIAIAVCGGAFFASGIVRRLVKSLLPASGDGPSEDIRKNGFVDTFTLAETDDQPPRRVIAQLSGEADPGYHLTAIMMTEAALALTLDHDKLPAMGKQGGVLTPATAMGDVLVDRLNQNELFELKTLSIEEWRAAESRKAR